MNKYILLIVAMFFCCLSCGAKAVTPKEFSGYSCSDFWEYLKKNGGELERSTVDLVNFWNYSIKIFRKNNPEITDSRIRIIATENSENQKSLALRARSITYLFTACPMIPENADKKFATELQGHLYQVTSLWSRKKAALEVNCRMLSPFSIERELAGKRGVVSACVNKDSKQTTRNFNSDGAAVFCAKYGVSEKCQEVALNAMNVCLATYGDCKPNQDKICAWHHTDKSMACIKSW